jgi:hypothetical protein
MGNALFEMPNSEHLESMVARLLRARPPVESLVSRTLSVSNSNVDFRSILLAGWLAWYSDERDSARLSFLNMNLLCDRGVLQQAAVDHWAEKTKLAASHVGT